MTIPSTAYAVPSQDDLNNNPSYWAGYKAGQILAPVIPSPTGAADFWAYRSWVAPLLKATFTSGAIVNYNVGYNEALLDGANWLWLNDPNSPHNKAS